MQSDETLFITFWNNVCSPTSERALLADLSMTSRCGVACILIAAAVSTFAMTAIISAVTAESDSPTGELGTDPNHVYHAHTGLCKSKNRAHSFAGHSHNTRIVDLPAPAELARRRNSALSQLIVVCARTAQITRSRSRACARRSATGTRAAPLTNGEPGATSHPFGGSSLLHLLPAARATHAHLLPLLP